MQSWKELPVSKHVFAVLISPLLHCVLPASLSSVLLRVITCPRLYSYSRIQMAYLFTSCQLCCAMLPLETWHCIVFVTKNIQAAN